MGTIWDKSEALGHPQLTDTFEQGREFVLHGMRLSAPIIIPGSELGPTPVAILTVQGAKPDEPGTGWEAYGTTVDVSVISKPIIDMAHAAEDEPNPANFPVIAAWEQVRAKSFDKDTIVLKLVNRTVTAGA